MKAGRAGDARRHGRAARGFRYGHHRGGFTPPTSLLPALNSTTGKKVEHHDSLQEGAIRS